MTAPFHPSDYSGVTFGACRYMGNAHEDLPAIWSVWVPAQLLNFGFSPMWFRVPFVAFVSAAWTAFVSNKRGTASNVSSAAVEEARPGASTASAEASAAGVAGAS